MTPYRNDTDRELPFRQESNFHYLSGCTVPGSTLLLTASSTIVEPTSLSLFIPPIEPADLMWSVPPPTIEAAKEIHDVGQVGHASDLSKAVADALTASPGALIHVLPLQSTQLPKVPESVLQLAQAGNAQITDAYLFLALAKARLIKDTEEIERIRKANAISSRAHETVMRVLGQGVKGLTIPKEAGVERPLLPSEWLIEKEAEAEAVFVASCRREGYADSYLCLLAFSVN